MCPPVGLGASIGLAGTGVTASSGAPIETLA